MQGVKKYKLGLFKSALIFSSIIAVLDNNLNVSFLNSAHAQNTSACFGQPTTALTFANPTLISGTNLQVGARYRFSDIVGDGSTDGIIEIINFANGASLDAIDNIRGCPR